ncbi:unnamed protein product [marine sediment metagenome]|uniref:CARDB domain-containing protein n=1 Tax=marine sediment metagenome TaxID=412755 RepID=X1RKR0_9ZZZZ
MPSAEGTYLVYLDVLVAGQLIGAYQAIEDIVITTPIVPWAFSNEECWLDWAGPGFGEWQKVNFSATITNVGNREATKIVTQWGRDYKLRWNEEGRYWYREWTSPWVVKKVTITLSPGASYNYINLGEALFGTYIISKNEPAENWLEDSDGYKSAVLTVTAH